MSTKITDLMLLTRWQADRLSKETRNHDEKTKKQTSTKRSSKPRKAAVPRIGDLPSPAAAEVWSYSQGAGQEARGSMLPENSEERSRGAGGSGVHKDGPAP